MLVVGTVVNFAALVVGAITGGEISGRGWSKAFVNVKAIHNKELDDKPTAHPRSKQR